MLLSDLGIWIEGKLLRDGVIPRHIDEPMLMISSEASSAILFVLELQRNFRHVTDLSDRKLLSLCNLMESSVSQDGHAIVGLTMRPHSASIA